MIDAFCIKEKGRKVHKTNNILAKHNSENKTRKKKKKKKKGKNKTSKNGID